MHMFIYMLEIVPRNEYLEIEVCNKTLDWEKPIQKFKVTFHFEAKSPLIDMILQAIRGKNFMEEG
jgi:hypothetical protein